MKYKDFFINEDGQLKGGVGDATAPSTVNPSQLAIGVQIEMEHTNNEKIATEIALDHLTEDPEYYTKLVAAGLAKEFQPQANSGFGDPKQSFNDKARLGNTVSCTPGNNVVGSMNKTPQGKVKDSDPVGPTAAVELDIDEPSLDELKKKKDRCHKKADSVYGSKTSAYKSGAIVQCRRGKIWKKKEESVELEEKKDFSKEKKQGLHGWFARRGGKGGKGWVDCNTCRKDPKTGTKKCKSCGRQSGEKRAKYPACRPTPSQCNKTGTRKKKGPSPVSWQKKKNETVDKPTSIRLTDILNDILKDT
jgi:hypothetical protein